MKPDWERIRAHYRHNEGAILQAGATEWGIDPYAWESEAGIMLTPIEAGVWHDIRLVGAVFYPQYPVGRRFVDFGNPAAKVAIECDGAGFHLDKEADAQRQYEIEAHGWRVYRMTGRMCLTDEREVLDEHGRVRFTQGDSYLHVKAITERHGLRLWAPLRAAA